MDRRDFLKLTAAAGLAVSSPLRPSTARASFTPYGGPYYVTIMASGGWDPTLLCDPKGRVDELELDPVNNYFVDEIEEVGPFKVPPVEGLTAFYEQFRDELLVINGIDCGTNSHDTGKRHTFSGSIDPGAPAFAALVAATSPDRPPLGFLANGGYEETAGTVPVTRIPDTSVIQALAYPDRLTANTAGSELYSTDTIARLRAARDARYQRQLDRMTLPREKKAISTLHEVRGADNELSALTGYLPATLDTSSNGLLRQAQVATATFKAGLAVSASLSIGGFDTHDNHDNNHTPNMQRIVEAIGFLMAEAESHGIADDIVIVVGSDFGRTPWYNEGNGKDHWSISSMLAMGRGIRGGRVIGATDDRQSPMTVDPDTLELDEDGIRITPGHVHAALRSLAGIDQHDTVVPFKVGEFIPLLG